MILLLAAAIWLSVFLVALVRRGVGAHRPLRFASGIFDDAFLHDLLSIGLIGAATAGFFWRLIFAADVWMPAGGGDLAQFLYPTYKFAAEWWRRGILPLWNPYLFAGMPFVGDIQSGFFYPLNLLTFLISSPLTFRDMEMLSVLHFFIAGAGMYTFLRWGKFQAPISNAQLSRSASLAGAMAFEFSDLFITHFGNLNLIAVAAWLPPVLLFYRRAVTDRRAMFAAMAGIFLAVAFLAGHVQAFLFIVIALGVFAIYHAMEIGQMSLRGATGANHHVEEPIQRFQPGNAHDDLRATKQSPRRDLEIASQKTLAMTQFRPLLFLALTAAVAFGLSAPALLPSIEMTQYTLRAAFSYDQAAQFSLPPAQLIGLFVPGFFGRGPQNAWGPWQRVEVGYIGVLPILLALLALVLRRDALTRFFGVLALLGLGFALGGYAILHGWLYQFAPGFGQLRAPARFIFLFDFALAALAAFGFDYLLHALPREGELVFKRIVRAAPWAFLLIALAAGSTAYTILILGQGQDAVLFARIANAANALALFILLLALALGLIIARATRFFHRTIWATLALALVFFDLFALGAYVDLSADDPTRAFDHPDAVAFLKGDGSFYRVDPRETGVERAWPADTSILYNLFDIDGDNPLVLADFDRYWNSMGSRSSPLYDLLNAKYLIGRKNVPLDRAKFRLAFDGDPALSIFENTRTLPRAFIVFDSHAVPDHAAALAAIRASDFDPMQTVVLERAVGRDDSRIAPTQNADVKIIGYGTNEILLQTNASSAGILVLSEVYYPGWRAWVTDPTPGPSPERRGEREVEVLRANYLFRAIELPAGAHRVRFLYDPASFKLGAGLFALTLLMLIGWAARKKIKVRSIVTLALRSSG